MSRMKDKLSRRCGVHAGALDDDPIAQRCLRPKPHQLHPDLRPALICAVGRDTKRARFTPRRYPKLPIVLPPAAAKKPDDSS
jgi:hypothetical protein